MNILFVHCIRKVKFGGGEKWVIAAADGLTRKGHNVVVSGRPNSMLLKAAAAAGVRTHHLNIFSDISIYHVFKAARFLRKHQTDVVITRSTDLTVMGLAALLVRKKTGKPVVVIRHGLPMMYAIRKHVFLLNKLAHGIITNTKSIQRAYRKSNYFPEGFTKVIYNGINTPDSVVDPDSCIDFGRRFPGKRIALSAGRLARQKGFRYLIEAIALLPERHHDLMFVILGDGKYKDRLQALAKQEGVSERIHFEGFVKDIGPYVAGCALFVLPSLYEGMSNAAMEAMAMEKAVVITNVNGASELVDDPGKGVLVPPADPHALAGAISELMDKPALRTEIGKQAAQHVRKHFKLSDMVDELEAFLQEKVSAGKH